MMIPEDFLSNGFALVPRVLGAAEATAIATRLTSMPVGRAGTRCMLTQDWCKATADRIRRHPALSSLVPPGFVAAQCICFEKSAQRNWLVPMHQDLSIPVARRVKHPALGAWSEKEGLLYVQPPLGVLQQLVAVRLHIDPCGQDDGPLRVVPGSHLRGRLEALAAARARVAGPELACVAARGSALAIRPLLLHASSKSIGNSRRRILHFLYGPPVLPYGLQWPETV